MQRSRALSTFRALALASQDIADMSSCAYDPTIRVPKLPTGPVRRLPQQFAPARARRWPRLAAVVVVGVLAVALGGALAFASAGSEEAHRSAQAEELLRMLGR